SYSIAVHSRSSLQARSCSNSFVLFSTRLIVLARQFGAARLITSAAPRPPLPAIVLYEYLPEIFRRVRKHFPSFRLSLHEAARIEAERLLQAGEIDIAITMLERKKANAVRSRALLELPLILLVKNTQRLTRAEELWGRDKIEETLITFRRRDPGALHFV